MFPPLTKISRVLALGLVLWSLLLSPLHASSNEVETLLSYVTPTKITSGWVRRKRTELVESGVKISDLAEAIEKEKQKALAENNRSLKDKLKKHFEAKGLGGRELSDLVAKEEEFLIQASNKSDYEERVAELNRLHREQAYRVADSHQINHLLEHDDQQILYGKWEEWLFLPRAQQKTALESLVKRLKEERATRAKLKALEEERRRQLESRMTVVKAEVEADLKTKNLGELEFDYVLRKEMVFMRTILMLPEDEHDAKYQTLHREDTKKFILRHKVLETEFEEEIAYLSKHWEKSFYFGITERIEALEKLYLQFKDMKVKEFRVAVREKLRTKGVSSSNIDRFINMEAGMYSKTLAFPAHKRKAESQKLHVDIAKKTIRIRHSDLNPVFHDFLASKWEEWLYKDQTQQEIYMAGLTHKLEGEFVTQKKTEILKKLQEEGLSEDTIAELLPIELTTEIKLLASNDAKEKSGLRHQYMTEGVLPLLANDRLFKDCPKSFLPLAAADWHYWLYNDPDDREMFLKQVRDELETEKIMERSKLPPQIKGRTKSKLEDYWDTKIARSNTSRAKELWTTRKKATLNSFDQVWSNVTRFSRRRFVENKKELRKDLENGNHTDASTDIVIKGLIEFFDQ